MPTPRPRAATWPPATAHLPNLSNAALAPSTTSPETHSAPSPTAPRTPSPTDSINTNPHSHFLTPLSPNDYYPSAWDSDSDSEPDDDFEWSAGITDFSLFTSEKSRAERENVPLSSEWEGVLADQRSAYRRAVMRCQGEVGAVPGFLAAGRGDGTRTRRGSELERVEEGEESEGMPGLTPDTSPRMHDDLEYSDSDPEPDTASHPGPTGPGSDSASSPPIPIPPRPSSLADTKKPTTTRFWSPSSSLLPKPPALSHNETPLQIASPPGGLVRKKGVLGLRGLPMMKVARPGLRGTRTLSGKAHAWRRPEWGIWDLEEGDEEAVEG